MGFFGRLALVLGLRKKPRTSRPEKGFQIPISEEPSIQPEKVPTKQKRLAKKKRGTKARKARKKTKKKARVRRCEHCKNKIMSPLGGRNCPRCGKYLCWRCFHEKFHKCEKTIKTIGTKYKLKLKTDRVLVEKDIKAIQKVWPKLQEYAGCDREVSGLIDYDGNISRIQVGARDWVEPYLEPNTRAEGILFHTHPNEDPTPSASDYKHSRLLKESGVKIKTIVVTQLGFSSYADRPPHTFYGFYEV